MVLLSSVLKYSRKLGHSACVACFQAPELSIPAQQRRYAGLTAAVHLQAAAVSLWGMDVVWAVVIVLMTAAGYGFRVRRQQAALCRAHEDKLAALAAAEQQELAACSRKAQQDRAAAKSQLAAAASAHSKKLEESAAGKRELRTQLAAAQQAKQAAAQEVQELTQQRTAYLVKLGDQHAGQNIWLSEQLAEARRALADKNQQLQQCTKLVQQLQHSLTAVRTDLASTCQQLERQALQLTQ